MAEVRTIAVTDEISHIGLVGRLDIEGVGTIEIPLTARAVIIGGSADRRHGPVARANDRGAD